MSTLLDVAHIAVTNNTTSAVDQVAKVTVTNTHGKGVQTVTKAKVSGDKVIAETYTAGPPGSVGPAGPVGPKGDKGDPGTDGATGPAGSVRIDHGNDSTIPRPPVPYVLWVGSVEPMYANKSVDLIVWTG